MKINIYYGGRGIIGDPSLYVINKMIDVFKELNVNVQKYDLYEMKNTIATLPQTLKDVDGILLASTVEWHGVGGYIYNFLDACWAYGDKEKLPSIYMAPIVMSTCYGEKEAELDLIKAWVTLGGQVAQGIAGYTPDIQELENNKELNTLIEKAAENIFRTISQKRISMPISVREMSMKVSKTKPVAFTQQETEQLTKYISDEKYVSKQKQDIKELADFFKGKLVESTENSSDRFISAFRSNFKAKPGVTVRYRIQTEDQKKSIAIRIDNNIAEIKEGDVSYPDMNLTLKEEILQNITDGRKTFQGCFMEGNILLNGDFKYLKTLDDLFPFMK